MDSANNNHERERIPREPSFDAAPTLGIVAANMDPSAYSPSPSIPEVGPLGSVEMLSNPEQQLGPHISTQQPTQQPQTVQGQVVVPQQSTTNASSQSVIASNPATAADEDLIEKEWVERVKKVVSGTKDDPHEQAKLVSELMRDYVRKRYGKEVGKAPDDI